MLEEKCLATPDPVLSCSTHIYTNTLYPEPHIFHVTNPTLPYWTISRAVSFHSPNGRHLPGVRAGQGDCQWPLKKGENSHQSHDPTINSNCGNPNLHLNHAIRKWWCQPIGSHASRITGSPNTTRLRLCSSLSMNAAILTCCPGTHSHTASGSS